ncbi:hypothetical protein [Embleya sp. NPDC005575]
MNQLNSQVEPFEISKWEVKEAWEEVRADDVARMNTVNNLDVRSTSAR